MCDRLIHVIEKALVTFDLTLAPRLGCEFTGFSELSVLCSVGLGRAKKQHVLNHSCKFCAFIFYLKT